MPASIRALQPKAVIVSDDRVAIDQGFLELFCGIVVFQDGISGEGLTELAPGIVISDGKSGLKKLAPGASLEHGERWTLQRDVAVPELTDEGLDRVLAPLV